MDEANPDFTIREIGDRRIRSPLSQTVFCEDRRRVLFRHFTDDYDLAAGPGGSPASLEAAGPREMIFFEPPDVTAAVVTCGGLCPGINDVIRAVVMQLYYRYGVTRIEGIPFGFQGLIPRFGHGIIPLNPEAVKDIHSIGGSILASSRGNQDIGEMTDTLAARGIDLLFCIGGDGTMRAAERITEEVTRRRLTVSVIGIPKTIDNDLNLIDRTFGFETAISEAVKVVQCAHVEAKGAPMGVGLIKIMGRQSGHIAVSTALAENDVNFVLVPEVPFSLDGRDGFLAALENRMLRRRHAVILVAEGAGQEFFGEEQPRGRDASGNLRLFDIGHFLKDRIERHFRERNLELNLKYFDPSYIIRSVPASANDSIYCELLGQYAVHAGMAGKTGMVVGLFNNEFVHLPIEAVTVRKKVDPEGSLWMRVLEATGQPASMK
jgi:6-phosphofructokinase 1